MTTQRRNNPFASASYRAAYRAQAVKRIERQEAADQEARARQERVVTALDPQTIYARHNGRKRAAT